MMTTYLVQRLHSPPKNDHMALAEQVFGGANLQLGPEAWKLLQAIFSFDYMGAAEYEFGTIPRCLKALAADRESLVAFEMVVPAKAIEPNWNRRFPARTTKGKPKKKQPLQTPVAARTVYCLARQDHVVHVQETIISLASGKLPTKNSSGFPMALDPMSDFDRRTCGWLELDNGYFFFLDKTMWRKTVQLFTGKEVS